MFSPETCTETRGNKFSKFSSDQNRCKEKRQKKEKKNTNNKILSKNKLKPQGLVTKKFTLKLFPSKCSGLIELERMPCK